MIHLTMIHLIVIHVVLIHIILVHLSLLHSALIRHLMIHLGMIHAALLHIHRIHGRLISCQLGIGHAKYHGQMSKQHEQDHKYNMTFDFHGAVQLLVDNAQFLEQNQYGRNNRQYVGPDRNVIYGTAPFNSRDIACHNVNRGADKENAKNQSTNMA